MVTLICLSTTGSATFWMTTTRSPITASPPRGHPINLADHLAGARFREWRSFDWLLLVLSFHCTDTLYQALKIVWLSEHLQHTDYVNRLVKHWDTKIDWVIKITSCLTTLSSWMVWFCLRLFLDYDYTNFFALDSCCCTSLNTLLVTINGYY